MFPGVGDHYENMAADLYRSEAEFRQTVDRCSDLLKPRLGLDLRRAILSDESGQRFQDVGTTDLRKMIRGNGDTLSPKTSDLQRTAVAQPAVFVVEYALARLLMSWGIVPQALIGYSVGEFVAATIAGVLSLEDALRLVATRAQLIDKLPGGSMLAVPLGESELRDWLGTELSIAVSNGPKLTVISGPTEAIEALHGRLDEQGIVARMLPTTHAFHSRMMEPAYDEFVKLLKTVDLKAPRIPYLSNLTGDWIKIEEATCPEYWAKHMCRTVRFADGVEQPAAGQGRRGIGSGPRPVPQLFREAAPELRRLASAVRAADHAVPGRSATRRSRSADHARPALARRHRPRLERFLRAGTAAAHSVAHVSFRAATLLDSRPTGHRRTGETAGRAARSGESRTSPIGFMFPCGNSRSRCSHGEEARPTRPIAAGSCSRTIPRCAPKWCVSSGHEVSASRR